MVDYYKAAGAAKPVDEVAALQTRWELTHADDKLVLVMVGLPARGKSFISNKLHGFLNWLGFRCRIFNVGQSRRKEAQTQQKPKAGGYNDTSSPIGAHERANFYDTANADAVQKREEIAMATLDELLLWLQHGGDIAIFDATNSNAARRRAVKDRVQQHPSDDPIRVVFIESICDDEVVLEGNLRAKVRSSPDFRGMDEEAALVDMRQRTAHYERAYQSVSDEEGSYIKAYNLSAKVTAKDIFGRLASSVLPYMMSIHIANRPIFLVALNPRGDEFVCAERTDVEDQDEASTPGTTARKFSNRIATWAASMMQQFIRPRSKKKPLRVLASTKPHAIEVANLVAAEIGVRPKFFSGLNPLDRGCSTVEADDDNQKLEFHQRYDGGGESFADLVGRLEPCVLDMEAAVDPVLVIAHVFPCRVLRAYFLGLDVTKTLHEPTSEGARALANDNESILEVQPQLGGGYTERIHDLTAATLDGSFPVFGLEAKTVEA
eukprot:TRINITY_DN30355_c0_g1_i1.p1 TRINITY_DN30355_c0_g1~~TRINITY_DN30355_c0_g1_i1.p1  ORF type:complete len:491 (-),score=67.68 TRINITY_DN30355_c0_g1_i1:240-1712(-)